MLPSYRGWKAESTQSLQQGCAARAQGCIAVVVMLNATVRGEIWTKNTVVPVQLLTIFSGLWPRRASSRSSLCSSSATYKAESFVNFVESESGHLLLSWYHWLVVYLHKQYQRRYDMRCYFNVCSKAVTGQLNLPQYRMKTKTKKWKTEKL